MAKLPILMYHDISPKKGEGLHVNAKDFEAQCKHLASKGYRTHHFAEILAAGTLLGGNNCIITFDDGYVDQLEFAVPILQKYKLKATFFIPLAYLGKSDQWNNGEIPIMTAQQLRSLPPETIELAYHSFQHRNYDALSASEVETDTQTCFQKVSEENLNFTKVLAYPYGKFPRKDPEKEQFFQQLKENGFQLALRIGNRIEKYPFHNPFEINRIDVKGEWSLLKFKRKLKFGKLF
ncbi:polysaccharide deacetylase family protein [Marinirhabdus gelatinilytica]|nr:polysaccharide deacetylase family protein [Marinirhabdus gelatinilytica]